MAGLETQLEDLKVVAENEVERRKIEADEMVKLHEIKMKGIEDRADRIVADMGRVAGMVTHQF